MEPRVIGEFADAALAKVVATEGVGFTAMPTIVAADAVERYGFEILGRTEECRTQLFLITAERGSRFQMIACPEARSAAASVIAAITYRPPSSSQSITGPVPVWKMFAVVTRAISPSTWCLGPKIATSIMEGGDGFGAGKTRRYPPGALSSIRSQSFVQ